MLFLLRHAYRRIVPDAIREPICVVRRYLRRRLWSWRLCPPGIFWLAERFRRDRQARQVHHTSDLSQVRVGEARLVSIVLPVYNGQRWLAEAIESILTQTHRQLELIAVNDGSTDDSAAILDAFAARDPRVRVFHRANSGLPAALSFGFQQARGEFLTWTSDDNRLKPRFLEKMIDCLERHADWDAVYANIDLIGQNGEPLEKSDWYRPYQSPPGSQTVRLPAEVSLLNTLANNYVGAAFLYRARVAGLIGDYSRARFTVEDYDYWMRINALLTLRHADFAEPEYEYRFHSASLTAQSRELKITQRMHELIAFDDFRRDFYLTPTRWRLRVRGGAPAQQLAEALRARILRAGDLIAPDEESELVPRLFFAGVDLLVTDDPAAAREAPTGQSSPAVRAVAFTGAKLPTEISAHWNLCVAVGATGELPHLPGAYRGWMAVPSDRELFTCLDIRARSHVLARMEEELVAEPPTDRPAVTVVVCTCGLTTQFGEALASLARQTLPADRFEVVVVNNRPDDPALSASVRAEVASRLGTRIPWRLIDCHTAGHSFAKNAAIAEAHGDIICFLDDDAIAREDWLEVVVRSFEEHPQAGVLGGRIVLKPPHPLPKVLRAGWEAYWSQYLPPAGYREVTALPEYPFGANWSARRQALMAIGGFRCCYGRKGNDYAGGEELVAAHLIARLGYRIGVNSASEVFHHVEPSRYNFRHIRRTVLAGVMIHYRAQRGGRHFPPEVTPLNTLLQLISLHLLRRKPAIQPPPPSAPGETFPPPTLWYRCRHWAIWREAYLRRLWTQSREYARGFVLGWLLRRAHRR